MSPSDTKQPVIIRFGKFKWLAAGFLFGVIAAMCLLSPMGSKGLFESNFMAYEDDMSQSIDMGLSTRAAGKENEAAAKALRRLRQGMDLYNEKKYAEAIPIFEEHLAKGGDSYDPRSVQFYLGVCYLATEEVDKAENLFVALLETPKFSRQEDTQWYLALTYIKQKKAAEAKTVLNELSANEGSKYKSQATALLQEADQPEGKPKERPVYFR